MEERDSAQRSRRLQREDTEQRKSRVER